MESNFATTQYSNRCLFFFQMFNRKISTQKRVLQIEKAHCAFVSILINGKNSPKKIEEKKYTTEQTK